MSGGYDIEARMAEVNGSSQRIAPIPEAELTEEMHAIARNLRAAFNLPENGYFPEVMSTQLRCPGLFQVQMDMGLQLIGRGTLSPRDRELAILRTGWLLGAPYEWGEHVTLGKRHGLTPEEVERVKVGSEAPEWNDHDRAICTAVEELRANAMITDETWAALARTWNDTQMMEFTVLIGQYTATAYQQNALRIRLPETNLGLRAK
jgi:4-carboxymuconolactone decarboxylase